MTPSTHIHLTHAFAYFVLLFYYVYHAHAVVDAAAVAGYAILFGSATVECRAARCHRMLRLPPVAISDESAPAAGSQDRSAA